MVQELCISNGHDTVCNHLAKYYLSVDEPPHIFWPFDDKIIPNKTDIVQSDSESGDKCHYVIENLTNGEAKLIFNKYGNLPDNITDLKICENEFSRQLEDSDLAPL